MWGDSESETKYMLFGTVIIPSSSSSFNDIFVQLLVSHLRISKPGAGEVLHAI